MDRPTPGTLNPPTITFGHSTGCVGGSPIDGIYVERLWLSRIGPTPLLLARFGLRNTGATIARRDVATLLGVKPGTVVHAAYRLHRFRFATVTPLPGEQDPEQAHDLHITVDRLVRPLSGADAALIAPLVEATS